MPQAAPIAYRPGPDTLAELERRSDRTGDESGPLSGLTRRELARYYAVLRDSLSEITLTEAEASLVADALNGYSLLMVDDPHTYRWTWVSVADAIRLNQLDQKWEVEDGEGLVRRLRDLSPGAHMALADAVERFWSHPRLHDLTTEELLREVGLLRG